MKGITPRRAPPTWTLLQTKHNGGIYTVLWESATRLTNNNSWHWPPNTSDSNPNNHHVPGQAWSTGTSLHIPDNGKDLMENLSEQVPGRTPELLASFTLQLVRAVTRSTQYLILVVLMADCCTEMTTTTFAVRLGLTATNISRTLTLELLICFVWVSGNVWNYHD